MLRIISPGFLLGIFLFHQLSELPSPWWLVVCGVFASAILWRRNSITYLLSALSLAASWAYIQSSMQLADPLPPAWYGKDIRVIGVISSLPEKDQHKHRFEFDVTAVLQPENIIRPQRLRLSWYQSADIELQSGQTWELTIRVKPARNFSNPGAFDYSAWLLQKGIRYTGYVSSRVDAKLLAHYTTTAPIQQLREKIRDRLKRQLGHLKYEPVYRALLIGDRSDVQNETWEIFQKTGTTHLMAISGLHVGLIAGFCFWICRYFWSRVSWLTLRIAAPRAAAIFAVLSAVIYAVLAGLSLPTQRALIMLVVVMGAVFVRRKTQAFDILSLALILVLFYDTHAILSASFWLSFFAVALILYIVQFRDRNSGKLRAWLSLQLGISLGLLPLTIFFFQRAPLISPLANLIAIPLVTLLIMPMLMFALAGLYIYPPIAVAVFQAADILFENLWSILNWFSQLPFASSIFAAPDGLTLFIIIGGVLIMLLPKTFRFRYLSVISVIPLALQTHLRPEYGEIRLTMLDVGQGLATVVETKEHVFIFDTGARLGEQFDLGDAVVLPYLWQQGHSRIDKLIVSHGDNDHIGGALSLLDNLPVIQLLTSVPDKLADHEPIRCEAGMQWTWDGVHMQVLYPDRQDYAQSLHENDLSCVIKIRTQNKSLLLTGDIESVAESRLVSRYGDELHSQVLQVPHHGSKTSSSTAFVQHVQPVIALVAAGWRNRFRFPHEPIVDRYAQIGSRLYTTGRHGALIYDSQTDGLLGWRTQHRRFWQQVDDVD